MSEGLRLRGLSTIGLMVLALSGCQTARMFTMIATGSAPGESYYPRGVADQAARAYSRFEQPIARDVRITFVAESYRDGVRVVPNRAFSNETKRVDELTKKPVFPAFTALLGANYESLDYWNPESRAKFEKKERVLTTAEPRNATAYGMVRSQLCGQAPTCSAGPQTQLLAASVDALGGSLQTALAINTQKEALGIAEFVRAMGAIGDSAPQNSVLHVILLGRVDFTFSSPFGLRQVEVLIVGLEDARGNVVREDRLNAFFQAEDGFKRTDQWKVPSDFVLWGKEQEDRWRTHLSSWAGPTKNLQPVFLGPGRCVALDEAVSVLYARTSLSKTSLGSIK